MEIEAGEYICPKCNGAGKSYESHTHQLPAHNHQLNQHNHSSSYAEEVICNRCCGAGKIDWVQKAMGEQKNNPLLLSGSHNHGNLASLQGPNEINFSLNHGADEVLKIAEDGFYYKGEKVEDAHDVYNRFNEWLTSAGY